MGIVQRVDHKSKHGWLTVRTVRNLGWILRHWHEVSRITVAPRANGAAWAFFMLSDGRRYVTDFMCASVLRTWLDRPVFRGLKGNEGTMGVSMITVGPYAIRRDGPRNWVVVDISGANTRVVISGQSYQSAMADCRKLNRGPK